MNSHPEEKINQDLSQWKTALVFSLLSIGTFLFIYSDIFLSLVNWWWTTSKYAHSLIIFPAIIYLIYEQRKELIKLSPKPNILALIPLTLSALLLPLFHSIDVQIVTETLLVLIIPLILWAIMGNSVLSVTVIPLSLLVTVAPIWELFAPILTEVTADVAHFALNVLGVPVFREEKYLTIPEGNFVIAEGCGGFRYFISGLSLGLIFAHLNYSSKKRQAVIIAAAVLLSIVTNWIRVMIVIWAGHVTDMQHPYVQAHVNLGWYVFAGAFFVFFFICIRLIPQGSKSKSKTETSTEERAPSTVNGKLAGSLVIIAILAPKIALSSLSTNDFPALPAYKFQAISDWAGPNYNATDWHPVFNGAEHKQMISYENDSLTVDIYYALYRDQSQGKELVNYNNSITNLEWKAHQPKKTDFFITKDSPITANKTNATTLKGKRVIWDWYNIGGVETSDKRLAKVLELRKFLSGNNFSMIIAASTILDNDNPEHLSQIETLLNKVYPEIITFYEAQEQVERL